MKKLRFIFLATLILVFVSTLSACVSRSDYDALQAKLQTSEANIASLQTTVSSLQGDLNSTKSALQQTQDKLNSSEANLKSTQYKLDTTATNLKSTQDKLDTTATNLKSTQDKLDTTATNLKSTQQKLQDVQKQLADDESKLKLYQDTVGMMYSGIQPMYTKTSSRTDLINVANNPLAKDPSWQELMSFIKSDGTDAKPYIPDVFICGAFAEQVQHNAEAAGIRSAIVFINFADSRIGHALNAFKTTDKGLVYIDCTGTGLQVTRGSSSQSYSSWDKIAYLVKNREYGLLGITNISSTDYTFYEKAKADWDSYEQRLDAYYSDVERYNAEIAGRIYYFGTPDWQRIMQWESNLRQQQSTLNAAKSRLPLIWKPLGIVSTIEIYW